MAKLQGVIRTGKGSYLSSLSGATLSRCATEIKSRNAPQEVQSDELCFDFLSSSMFCERKRKRKHKRKEKVAFTYSASRRLLSFFDLCLSLTLPSPLLLLSLPSVASRRDGSDAEK